MDATTILIVLSSVATFAGIVPYIIDVIKGRTKPRVTSWFVWGCLSAVSFVAAIVEHQYPTAALMLCSLFTTMSVVILGWKGGNNKFNLLDIVCLIGALVGIILWAVFNSPSIAVIAMVCIDFIGGIPTQVHSWKKPKEETLTMFIMSGIGALLTLLAIKDWKVTAFAFPLFLLLINLDYVLIIVLRRIVLEAKKR